MMRSRLIIVSRHKSCAEALVLYCRAFIPPHDARHLLESMVFETSVELFEKLDSFSPADAAETMVIYDGFADHYGLWDAGGIGIRERGIGVRLVLQYPEIYFAFLTEDNIGCEAIVREHHLISLATISRLIKLVQLHGDGFRALYDPTGFRSFLKARLVVSEGVKNNSYLACWESQLSACVIEDELTFAHFNAYAAYRSGFGVFLVTSYKELERLLPVEVWPNAGTPPDVHTIITDWSISFADFVRVGSADDFHLEKRLRKSTARIFVVTSQKDNAAISFLEATNDPAVRAIVEGEEVRHRVAEKQCLAKPYAGVFELVELLDNKSEPTSKRHPHSALRRTKKESGIGKEEAGKRVERHTAPYAHGLIAESLLLRAKRMSGHIAGNQRLLLLQAMLAGEAKEILGGLSATTFLEALSQQNTAEIRAEATYLGMLGGIDPVGRLNALEAETAFSVLSDPGGAQAIKMRLSYLTQQVSGFRRIYNEHEEVSAAEICLLRMAEQQRRQLWHEHGWLNKVKWFGMWYTDIVTKSGTSVARLLIADVVIVCLFDVLFAMFLLSHACNTSQHFGWLSLAHSVFSFVEVAPGLTDYEDIVHCARQAGASLWVFLYRFVLLAEITLAYINLGLLIAMLYRRVIRRVP